MSLHFTELSLDRFKHVIVLDQLFPYQSSLYLHNEPSAAPLNLPSILTSSVPGLPPGPAHSFFQAGINNTYVISGYDASFAAGYMSALPVHVPLSQAVEVANTLVTNIISLLEPTESVEVHVNSTYLNELLSCFAGNGQCGIIEEILGLKPDSLTNRQGNHEE